jgi:MFS family permease
MDGASAHDTHGAGGPASPPARGGALTVGLVLGVTVMAFGALAVVTIAPRIPADLGGLSLYGWIFSGYLLASLFGTVWGGQQADRHGPARAFTLGLTAFAVGAVIATFAPSMGALVTARVIQGLGSGAVVTCIYVAVTRAYRDQQRPRVLALLSTGWIVPALIGPAVAGTVAELTSWRWVFAGLVPLTAVVAVLTVPTFARLPRSGRATARGAARLAAAAVLAVAVGAVLWSLTGPGSVGPRLVLGVAAAIAVPSALGRLTPPRTLRLGPGLGAVVAARGAFFAAFITVEVYLALMLTEVHGYSSPVTGIVIATGAISWSLGAWTQARLDARAGLAPRAGGPVLARVAAVLARRRDRRVLVGTALLGSGLLVQSVALHAGSGAPYLPLAVALAGWLAAGLGIGFAHASSTALAFVRAEAEGVEAGAVSSALQLADSVSAALATGVGGALLAFATAAGMGLVVGVNAAFATGYLAIVLSLLASIRIGIPAVPAAPARP